MEVRSMMVARQCIAQMAPLAAERNVALRQPSGSQIVLADERRLGQILLNLLSNAIKFTPSGGRVTVTVTRQPGFVEIAVADTGIGLAREDHDRIFSEYSQVVTDGGDERGGTGLGLPLSLHLAKRMGGTIVLESVLGSGSTFKLWLPAAPRSQ
jgi:two-component system sensor histidine kinase/response regulator